MLAIVKLPHSTGSIGHVVQCPVQTFPIPVGNVSDKLLWNSNTHYRKYMYWHGDYIDNQNQRQNGNFCFWGEWEPESYIIKTCNSFRKCVYYPVPGSVLQSPQQNFQMIGCPSGCGNNNNFPCNTDPCVFGQTFKYITCQQRSGGELTKLDPGSMILFGSTSGTIFYLDTVLIVDFGYPYTLGATPPAINGAQISPEYQNITVNRLTSPSPKQKCFYRGKTFSSPDVPYSFVPAELSNGQLGTHKKAELQLTDPLFKQFIGSAGRGATWKQADSALIVNVWSYIMTLCRQQGFVPVVQMNYP